MKTSGVNVQIATLMALYEHRGMYKTLKYLKATEGIKGKVACRNKPHKRNKRRSK